MESAPDGILINKRRVSYKEIMSSTAEAKSDFERSTFQLMRACIEGTNTFEFHTSGSTGDPKQLSFTRQQIRHSAIRTINALGMTRGETVLVCLDTKYIAGKMMIVRALEAGLNIVAIEPSSDPFENIEQGIDYVSLVPLQVESILKNQSSLEKLRSLKGVLIGGAPMSATLREQLQSLNCPIYATYGMTETLSNIALQKISGMNPDRYFRTMEGVSIRLDERGCLVIEDTVTDITVTTNDVAEIISETEFTLLGRADDVINMGGVKIHPELVEAKIEVALRDLGVTSNFMVSFIPDDRLGQCLVLLIEGAPNYESTKLLERVNAALDPYERPKSLHILDKFGYTPSGKMHRRDTARLIPKSSP